MSLTTLPMLNIAMCVASLCRMIKLTVGKSVLVNVLYCGYFVTLFSGLQGRIFISFLNVLSLQSKEIP
jgi:hypothetical protein